MGGSKQCNIEKNISRKSNWQAFLTEYSKEHKNGYYVGPQIKPKLCTYGSKSTTSTISTKPRSNWEAFFKDYSDEYKNGYYVGLKK